MAYAKVTQTGTDVTIIEVPWDKIMEIDGVYIFNASSSVATIVLKDKYKYSLGDSAGNDGERVIIETRVQANSGLNLTKLQGEEIIGTLVVNSDQQPIDVYVGVKEKGGFGR